MSSDPCLALLFDAPMQSWGHSSRFTRRSTALHPTRSAVIGMISAAMGINKYDGNEDITRFDGLRLVTVTLPRPSLRTSVNIQRMCDYHTVTGIRRASGKVEQDATVQTYRDYLLDARFGTLIEGPAALLEEIAAAMANPRWGVWLGRKCCIPASPVLASPVSERQKSWRTLLERCGYTGIEALEAFDHVIEVSADTPGADMIEDRPIGYGRPIGERHSSRWICRISRQEPVED